MIFLIDCFIKKNSELSRLEINEIYFFCKINNKTIAVTKNSKIEINCSLYSISTLLEKTPFFMRTHKSYIVNIHKIEKIAKYNNRTYNLRFKGIDEVAYCTLSSYKILCDQVFIL